MEYLDAKEPVSKEWNIIIVSSKSHTNTRSKLFSASGAGGLEDGLPITRLPLPLPIRPIEQIAAHTFIYKCDNKFFYVQQNKKCINTQNYKQSTNTKCQK